jgi:hypothetical protein
MFLHASSKVHHHDHDDEEAHSDNRANNGELF